MLKIDKGRPPVASKNNLPRDGYDMLMAATIVSAAKKIVSQLPT